MSNCLIIGGGIIGMMSARRLTLKVQALPYLIGVNVDANLLGLEGVLLAHFILGNMTT